MLALFVVSLSPFAGAQERECNGTVPSLDEMKYMDEDDLRRKICFWDKSAKLYLDAQSIDGYSDCSDQAELARKVLEKDFDAAPPTAEECAKMFD